MSVHYTDATVTLHHGDCLDVLRSLPDASVDSVVTDPPYGLEFMGKDWDRLGDIGKASHGGFTTAAENFKGMALPKSYNASANVKCQRCSKWKFDHVGRKCDCGPDAVWPNVKAQQARAMQEWHAAWATECLRVLKPGGHLLAFGGTRTWHRLTCAIEDAGFEIRDGIAWLYGSGFPKSLNLVDEAGERTGWGTALKPAFEPVVVARKPLTGTVAANVLAWGTGALNVDGCRIEAADALVRPAVMRHDNEVLGKGLGAGTQTEPAGRWPANVVLDESQAEALDEQSGTLTSGANPTRRGADGDRQAYGTFGGQDDANPQRGIDVGGASRFFFIAREDNPCHSTSSASTVESPSSHPRGPAASAPSDAATSASHDTARPTGSPSTNGTPSASRPSGETSTPTTTSTAGESLHDWQPAKPSQMVSPARYAASLSRTDTTTTTTSPSTSAGSVDPTTSSTTQASAPGVPLDELGSRFNYVAKADAGERPRVNGTAHPTVKPLALMRWLVRLVTPPGGTVLEPFAGSGTTVEACIVEGFHCIAIEREADYLPLIEARIARRRDPVKAITLAGDYLGLFGEATG